MPFHTNPAFWLGMCITTFTIILLTLSAVGSWEMYRNMIARRIGAWLRLTVYMPLISWEELERLRDEHTKRYGRKCNFGIVIGYGIRLQGIVFDELSKDGELWVHRANGEKKRIKIVLPGQLEDEA